MRKTLKRTAVVLTFLLLGFCAALLYAYVTTPAPARLPATVDDDPTVPHIVVNDRAFHSETFGDPARPTMIVLHGGPGGDYRYLLDLQAFADRYFVVFYDQRGSGLSTRIGADALTAQDMVDDLDAIAGHYSPDRPVTLIGHSWGAMLASAYVGQHPDRVAKLVLAEPGALTDEAMSAFQAHFMSLMDPGLLLTIAPAYIEALHVPDPVERADYVAARQSEMWSNDPDNPYHCPDRALVQPMWRFGAAAAGSIQSSARTSDGRIDMSLFSRNAARFTKPVLFLAGACDTWLGETLQRQQAALFPAATVVVIPEAGHLMFSDNLATSLAAVRAYLDAP